MTVVKDLTTNSAKLCVIGYLLRRCLYNIWSYSVFSESTKQCKRAFSKMVIVKSKLCSTMAQERLDALLTIFIEQKIANSLDMDYFKTLTPI
jgi:hypothetical protein